MIRYRLCFDKKGEEIFMEMQLQPPLVGVDQVEKVYETFSQFWATDFGKRAFIKSIRFDHLEYWNENHQCWVTVQ